MNGQSLNRLKAITKGTLLVALILMGMVLMLQAANDFLFAAKTVEARSNADFEKKKQQVRLLFIGASDMEAAMVPTVFDMPAFNYAMHNEFYIGTYYKLKRHIDEMPALETVVLPVDVGSFLSYWSLRTDVPAFKFIDGKDLAELYHIQGIIPILQKLRRYGYVMNRSRFKEFMDNLGNLILNRPIPQAVLIDGYRKDRIMDAEDEDAAAKARLYFAHSDPFDKTMLLYFKKILQLCHDRGITVVTETIPKTDVYFKTAEQYVTMEQIYARVLNNPEYSRYIRKHFNFQHMFDNRQELFSGANHLKYEGALLLSAAMAERLKELYPSSPAK